MPAPPSSDPAAASRRGGRPRLAAAARCTVRVALNLTPAEAAQVSAAAAAASLPLAAWARVRLLRDRSPARSQHAELVEIWRDSSTIQSNFNQLVSRLNELHSAGELHVHTAAPTLVELRQIAPRMYRLVKALRLELTRVHR